MNLCITLATRGRPQQLLDTVRRSVINLVLPDTVFVVHIDEDDAPTIAVGDALLAIDKRIRPTVRPREDTIAEKWNRGLETPADLYLVAADDDPYITPAYDAKLIEAAQRFPDGIGMVYGCMANASFSGAVCPTAKFCELMGNKICPEYFPYWFWDHWTDDVAKLIGRISFANVRTDQSRVGKTQELREPAWWATWFDAAYYRRRRDAEEMLCAMRTYGDIGRYEINRAFIEHRSRWTNNHVRATAKQLEGMFGRPLQDERYQRVKQKAVAMVPDLLAEMTEEDVAWMRPILNSPTEVVGLKRAWA